MKHAYRFRYIALAGIALVFLFLRLMNLSSSFLMIDDILTIGPLYTQHEKCLSDISATVWQVIHDITNPPAQTFFMRLALHLSGPNLAVLRLPNLVIAVMSLGLLSLLAEQLFTHRMAVYATALLWTFSVPSIIYAQQIQPTIQYFFSTIAQLYIFVRILRYARSEAPALSTILQHVGELTLISFGVFFFNYMSALLYAICISFYGYALISSRKRIVMRDGRYGIYALSLLLIVAAYGWAFLWRMRLGGVERAYFEGLYYIDRLADVPRLLYDFLSYHLNFAYTPALYLPLGANLLAIPYMAVFVLGVVFFIRKNPQHIVLIFLASAAVVLAASLKLMPFGGIRHSFILAPCVFLCVGYGIDALFIYSERLSWSRTVRLVVSVLLIMSVGIFCVSGKNLYAARNSRLDLSRLAELAEERHIATITGWMDTYPILEIMNATQGDMLTRQGLQILPYGYHPDASCLLVTYRHTLHPPETWPREGWQGWDYALPREQFNKMRITPLIEDPGLLDIHAMGIQSIYYPLNGFFVYLIEKNG